MFTPEKRAFLIKVIGEDKVRELEEETKALSERVRALGVEFKALDSGEIVVPEIASAFERFDVIIDQMMKQDKDLGSLIEQIDEVKESLDEYAEKRGWVREVMGKDDGRIHIEIQ